MKVVSVVGVYVLLLVSLSLLNINVVSSTRNNRGGHGDCKNSEPDLEELGSMTLELFRLLDLAAGEDGDPNALLELFIWLSQNTGINDESIGLTFSFDGIHPNAGIKNTFYSIDDFVSSVELNGLIQERHLFNSPLLTYYDNINNNATVSRYYQHWAQFYDLKNTTQPGPYHIHHNAYSTIDYQWTKQEENDDSSSSSGDSSSDDSSDGNNYSYDIRITQINDDWFFADWRYDPSFN